MNLPTEPTYLPGGEELVKELASLINNGDPEVARFKGTLHLIDAEDAGQTAKIGVHYQVFLAETLLLHPHLEESRRRLKRHPDFNQKIGGDAERDVALMEIRLGKYEDAQLRLPAIIKAHAGDPNREALVDMLQSRIYMGLREYDVAYHHARLSLDKFSAIKDDSRNWQWYMNAMFQYLKACAAYDRRPDKSIYEMFVASELRRDKRVLAKALYYLPQTAFEISNWLEKRSSKKLRRKHI